MTLPGKSLIDDGSRNLSPLHTKTTVARALISALSDGCRAYCILSGYEELPESFDTDIDFMVDQEDFQRIPRIIEDVARQTNTQLFQSIEHEITARAFLLVSLSGPTLTMIQLDSASDYRHFGPLWLRAKEVLETRRWHPRGFWIPSASHEFTYYLIKRLNKRDFGQQHGTRLHRLYAEDSHACDRMIARFWGRRQRSALICMAASNDWTELSASLESFRAELMRHTGESIVQRILSIPKRTIHVLGRIARPTGAWIAFIGPDGSGKSVVIDAVRRQFAPAFRDVRCFHMRPRLLRRKAIADGPVTDPHGQAPRGLLASIAKAFYFAADYYLGYAFQIAPALSRTRLILFDRYIYDLVVDSKRVRYGGPGWLLRLVARAVPRPDLVILLDAPAEVLWSRKREVPFDEVIRQRSAYLQLARKLPSTIVVNAAQPVSDVIHEVACALIAHFSRRTAERLELQVSPFSASGIESDAPSFRC
jgi:thymidylate kinase